MLKYRKIGFCLGVILLMQFTVDAQNSTNSPYTRFGYGNLADRSFGAGRSMGGIGYGLRSPKQINPMNPASYSCMDSLTFLFDAGFFAQSSWLDDGINKRQDLNGNLEYLAIQFPVSRRIAMSVGMLPYSNVGYDFVTKSQDDVNHVDQFWGSGGLNQVYLGASIDIWKKRLSLGANVGYLFGNIQHESSLSIHQNVTSQLFTMKKVSVYDLKYDVGIQYVQPLSKEQRVVFGATYSPKLKIKNVSYDLTSTDRYQMNLIESDTVRNQGFDLPHSIGFGATYVQDNKWTLGADVLYETWSDVQFFNQKDAFKDRMKIAAGGEYIPNLFTRSYLNRVRYRAGIHYSNSYQQIKGAGFKEYGVSVGAGFPMMDNRSFINASFEYVHVAPEVRTMVKEQYLCFRLSYTFNEFWFFKRKVD